MIKNNKELENQVINLLKENEFKDARILQLEDLCELKDAFYDAMMSDGLRHGSSLAAQQVVNKRLIKNK